MSKLEDDSRYGFHAHLLNPQKGVTVDFVLDRVLKPMIRALENTTRAASFKPNDLVYKDAVKALKDIISSLNSILKTQGIEKGNTQLDSDATENQFKP